VSSRRSRKYFTTFHDTSKGLHIAKDVAKSKSLTCLKLGTSGKILKVEML